MAGTTGPPKEETMTRDRILTFIVGCLLGAVLMGQVGPAFAHHRDSVRALRARVNALEDKTRGLDRDGSIDASFIEIPLDCSSGDPAVWSGIFVGLDC
jgi:hypothetical protein